MFLNSPNNILNTQRLEKELQEDARRIQQQTVYENCLVFLITRAPCSVLRGAHYICSNGYYQ